MNTSPVPDRRTTETTVRQAGVSFTALCIFAYCASPLAGQLDSTRIRNQCRSVHPIENQSILYGTITDGRSGLPLPGGRVHLTWATRTTETGREIPSHFAADSEDGAYVVCDVPQETRMTVWADALSMTSWRVALILEEGEMHREDLDVLHEGPMGAVSGILLDDSTAQPISGATVRIPGARGSVVTESNGRFRIAEVPAGLQELVIRHVAYGEPTAALSVAPGVSTNARIRLAPRPIAVAPIAVEVTARSRWLEETEFYDRLERGLGAFVTPEEIDRQRYRSLADVLRTIPAVNLRETCAPHCEVYIRMAGQTMTGCLPTFYVDGRQLHGLPYPIDLDMIAVAGDLAAVEVYRGISETPPQFYGRCGSIVIWTRRGAG
ncbi:carboxypeptidase regulatory-like domain-containing protein [Candidatus Palauibacter sp.]|uniref:carboxypeptidase regulatory-like domain-containing protein n=1 Tax=Candidatus Palauibacter sp. TaxID=3101350 RepID=UPI003AF2F6E4